MKSQITACVCVPWRFPTKLKKKKSGYFLSVGKKNKKKPPMWTHFSPAGLVRSCAPVWRAPRAKRLWSAATSKLRWRRRPPGCTFCPGTNSAPPGIKTKQGFALICFSLCAPLRRATSCKLTFHQFVEDDKTYFRFKMLKSVITSTPFACV